MGRILVNLKLTNDKDILRAEDGRLPRDQIRQTTARGVVDTGATRLVIPAAVAEQLGLSPNLAKWEFVMPTDAREHERLSKISEWALLDREFTFRAIVEPDRDTVLIGAIVLEELDFVADCVARKLLPRDPNRIIAEIE